MDFFSTSRARAVVKHYINKVKEVEEKENEIGLSFCVGKIKASPHSNNGNEANDSGSCTIAFKTC